MRTLVIDPVDRALRVLCIGAHSDDIEIGCGGTMQRLMNEHQLDVRWVVLGCSGERVNEAQASADALLKAAVARRVDLHRCRDGFFPYEGARIKDIFETLKGDWTPDLIFTHTDRDRHQDHRLVNELTWNTFRNHLILEYEIPKYDGDLGTPNVFVALSAAVVEQKIAHLLAAFPSQRGRHWFDAETFRALMRLRGVESVSTYAEAFYARKLLI